MSDFDSFVADLGRPATNLVVAGRLGSTQNLSRRIAAVYAADGETAPPCWVVAHAQDAGRGRRGRSWSSPPGRGVYATRSLGGEEEVEVALLPLLVAVTLAEALDPFLPADRPVRLKWPNDLVVEGRKLGGILIEVPAGAAGGALVGFGVNHGQRADELPELSGWGSGRGATSLALEGGAVPSLGTVARRLIDAVDAALGVGSTPPDLVDRYAGRSVHRPGDAIACQLGERVVTGVFRGFGPAGELRLETAEGERLVAAGEILENVVQDEPGGPP